ncbi:MAG TPA: serine/threonine-protein kinase [Oculatellaceae cyanobacterium]
MPSQYEIEGKISQGGMGAIYKAQNRYTGAMVAIKTIKVEAANQQKALQRFIAEAQACARLRHPRICQVHDFGLTDSQIPFLVMDFINGIPLGKKVQRDGRIMPAEAVVIFQQIAEGLEHAHGHRVVHRDLKPDNIMLSRDEGGATLVQIVDFGIAKVLVDDKEKDDASQLTSTGSFVGTPLFMSPEQARSKGDIDHRSDIYSLGCVMYYILSGVAPFVGSSAIETIAKHLHQAPPEFPTRLKIRADLRAIVFKCLEKKPDDRYQSVQELSADLKKLTLGVSIKRRPLTHERELRRKNVIRIIYFVVGFAIMYGISLVAQNAMGPAPHTERSSSGGASGASSGSSGSRSGHRP